MSQLISPESLKRHRVYIIFSEFCIDDIRAFLESCTNNKYDVGTMRLDHLKSNKETIETNRTIVSLNPDLFEMLRDSGYEEESEYDFRIKPYDIRKNNYPPEDCCYSIYIVFPIQILSFRECKEQIASKLNELEKNKMIKEEDYKLIYPSFSKSLEEENLSSKAYCVIIFTEEFLKDIENTIFVKLMLDQTKWWKNEQNYILRASWCKKKTVNFLMKSYKKHK